MAIKDCVAVVKKQSKMYFGSGDIYVKVEKEGDLETIRTFEVDTGFSIDTYEIITGYGKVKEETETWAGGKSRKEIKEYELKHRPSYVVELADEANRSKFEEFVRISGKGKLTAYFVGFAIDKWRELYQGKWVERERLHIYVPGKYQLFDTQKKKLPAKTLLPYLLNQDVRLPRTEYPFQLFGCTIGIAKGLSNGSYWHHASGTSVLWDKLYHSDEPPENCKNEGIFQTYFYITDGKDTFLIRYWGLGKGYLLTLVMPESEYGALITYNYGDNKMVREIRQKEIAYLNEDWPGYYALKLNYDDFWVGIKPLPDGRYRMEEWSDSSGENDVWEFDTIDGCIKKAAEMYDIEDEE